MSAVDAVVTDLDGTVVRRDGSVSAATLRAADALRARGIPLVAATARTPAGLEALQPLPPHLSFAVCCTGAIGYLPATRKLIWREQLPPDVVIELMTLVADLFPEAGLAAYDGSRWRMTSAYEAIRPSLHKGPTAVVDERAVADGEACSMVIAHPELTSQQIIDSLLRHGLDTTRLGLHSAGVEVVEVTAGPIDKASGVLRALGELGVAPERAIAFGDMPIDVAMFAVVGRSFAMADAPEAVRAAATSTTASVEEDGFAQALAALGLGSGAGVA